MAAVGVKAKRQAPTRRWQRGRGGGTDRAPVQSTRGAELLFLWRSHGVYAWSRDHRRQSCAVFLATDGSTIMPLQAWEAALGLDGQRGVASASSAFLPAARVALPCPPSGLRAFRPAR